MTNGRMKSNHGIVVVVVCDKECAINLVFGLESDFHIYS